jgi:hypothetical protein
MLILKSELATKNYQIVGSGIKAFKAITECKIYKTNTKRPHTSTCKISRIDLMLFQMELQM